MSKNMNKNMSVLTRVLGLVLAVTSTTLAMVTEIELPLVSYHIKNDITFEEAPNKIDDKAVWVLNPGLLVGLDSRKDTNTPGFSLLGKGGYLQDCANETVYLVGGGGRYRAFIRERVSLDANLYVFMADAYEAWGDGENRVSKTLPVANLGINYHLKNNKTIGTTVTYIPEDTAIAATSGTDLLFFTANIAF